MAGAGQFIALFLAILFAIPMSYVSDKTQRRGLIAAGGLSVAGILLITLPLIASPVVKMAVMTLSIA